MNDQELKEKIGLISNADLVKKAQSLLNQLCKTGGKSFIMCVPPQIDDTDIIFSELINRFEKLNSKNIYKILDKIEFEKHVKKLSSEIKADSECSSELYLSNYILFLIKEFNKEIKSQGAGQD